MPRSRTLRDITGSLKDFDAWVRSRWAKWLLAAIGVLIPIQAWDDRGALFGVVALLSFTPVFAAYLVPVLYAILARVPGALFFGGMAFVLLGTWFDLPALTCALVASIAAMALALVSRRPSAA